LIRGPRGEEYIASINKTGLLDSFIRDEARKACERHIAEAELAELQENSVACLHHSDRIGGYKMGVAALIGGAS
jgi:hypothetical protein